ncbi:MAG: two-component system chemotaxis response regulator CheY [Alteromonadaceae bacterium]|jgi:two-component system chemotaxis response regulator CheY
MHILIVDDKQPILDLVSGMLTKSGHTVDVALNGLDAFEKTKNKDFDLFIIDHLMPLMNGIQLSKNIQLHERSQRKPIIFMTTQDVKTLNLSAVAELFFEIISKPIDESHFMKVISQLNIENTLCHSL